MENASNTLLYSISETGVATITLNRPEVLNSLNEELMANLLATIVRADADPAVRCILMTGTGRGFSAGADLGNINLERTPQGNTSREETIHDSLDQYLNPIVSKMMASDKPIIAAVNGVVAGGGVGLALAADIIIAAQSASFVQVFVPQLGIIPDMGCTWQLPRLIGRARTIGLAMLGEKLPAATAEAWGLIWKCVPDAELLSTSAEIADRLAQSSAFGIASFKKAMRASNLNSYDQQLDLEKRLQTKCCGNDDFAEGSVAFREKRKPKFN